MSWSEKLFWIALVGLDVWLFSLGSSGPWIAAGITLASFLGSFLLNDWARRHIWRGGKDADFFIQPLWYESQLKIWRSVEGGKDTYTLETTPAARIESRSDAPIHIKEIRCSLRKRVWFGLRSKEIAKSNSVIYYPRRHPGTGVHVDRLDLSIRPLRIEPHQTSDYFFFKIDTPLPASMSALDRRYTARVVFIVTGTQLSAPLYLSIDDGFGQFQSVDYDDTGKPSVGASAKRDSDPKPTSAKGSSTGGMDNTRMDLELKELQHLAIHTYLPARLGQSPWENRQDFVSSVEHWKARLIEILVAKGLSPADIAALRTVPSTSPVDDLKAPVRTGLELLRKVSGLSDV